MHPSKLEKGRVYTGLFDQSQELFLGLVNTLELLGVKKGANGSASDFVVGGTQNHTKGRLWLLGRDDEPFQRGASFDDVLKSYDDDFNETTFCSLLFLSLKIDVDAGKLPLDIEATEIFIDIPANALDAIKDRIISDVFFEASIVNAINYSAILNMTFEGSVPTIHPSIKQFAP